MKTPKLHETCSNSLPQSLHKDFTEWEAQRQPARVAQRRLRKSLDLPLLLFGFACFLRLHLGPSAMILSLSLKRSRSRVTSLLLLLPPPPVSPLLLTPPLPVPWPLYDITFPPRNTWFATHWALLRHHLLKHLSTWPLLLAAHGCVFFWKVFPNGCPTALTGSAPDCHSALLLLTAEKKSNTTVRCFLQRWKCKESSSDRGNQRAL